MLIPLLAMSACGFGAMASAKAAAGNVTAACVGGALALACALGVVALYAPWTCFWAVRTLAGLIALAYVAYFVDDVATGAWTGSGQSALLALGGLVVIGLPALKIMLSRRSSVSPYDDSGSFVGATVIHELWPDPATPAERYDEACAHVVDAVTRMRLPGVQAELDIIDGLDERQQVTVLVPRGPEGERTWAELQAELTRQGIAHSSTPPAVTARES